MKILLVDDDLLLCDLGRECLEINGYIVYTACNGLEALKIASEKELDIIILDLNMPGMDGFETLKKLKIAFKKETEVLALTGCTSPKDDRRCLTSGFNGVLHKPYTMNALLDIIS